MAVKECNVSVETSDDGAARVAITLPPPDQIAAVVLALFKLWQTLRPIIGAVNGSGDVAAILAALTTTSPATTTAATDATSPGTTTAAPTGTRPNNPGPGTRR